MNDYHISLTARPGWLRMYGRSGLASKFSQTLIARRMTEYHMKAAACMEFEPEVQFFYGYAEAEMQKIGPCIDAGFLSDEACKEGWFTGTMIGICCQDLTGYGKYADFDWFEVL